MTEYAAITPERHANKAWKRYTSYAFAALEPVIPLVGAELSKTAPVMPVGFIRKDEHYQLMGITSLQTGQNLYVAPSGQWLGTYVPAALRGHPFRLLQPEGAKEAILCVNEASGLVVDAGEGGEAFFDDQGQPSQALKDILNFLSEVERNRTVTQQAVNVLAEARLIVPWELNLKQGEKIVPVTGLYRVDEAALTKLEDDAFLSLRRSGALPVAYAQLLAMNQLAVLERLGQVQGQLLAQQTAKQGIGNLEGFSLSEEDGSLKFH